jgi:RecA/RadA recombinase
MKRTRESSLSSQIKKKVSTPVKRQPKQHIDPEDLVPMGSTLLNLAMSGSIEGGAKKGTMVNIIGSSHGGKTMLALTSFAETNMKKSFDDYSFIYDDVECANSFNMPYLFGKQTARRIKPARPEKDETFSSTVQHFHANVSHHLKKDIPFLYVLDSFDALDAKEDQKKMEEMVDALEKDKKDVAGTYGMAKAKASSSILRILI